MSQEDKDRYLAAAQGMQYGVAMEMHTRSRSTELKHLRVGVNSAMVDSAGLATLLIEKGIITGDEYEKALADAMEHERERYEALLSEVYKSKVVLR